MSPEEQEIIERSKDRVQSILAAPAVSQADIIASKTGITRKRRSDAGVPKKKPESAGTLTLEQAKRLSEFAEAYAKAKIAVHDAEARSDAACDAFSAYMLFLQGK
jgi:hypothetical protein